MPKTNAIRESRRLLKDGKFAEATARLHSHLREPDVSTADFEGAGRLLSRALVETGKNGQTFHVHLVAQCTTSFLLPLLTAEAWARGVGIRATEADYDSMLQSLYDMKNAADRPDVIVLFPWTQRLCNGDERSADDRFTDEMTFLNSVWAAAEEVCSNVIQVGYDWTHAGPSGFHLGSRSGGAINIVRQINNLIRQSLPAGMWFTDLESISGVFGRTRFYDQRSYHWTKNPMSQSGSLALARHLWAGVRAITTGAKKVLAVDLDNTLWGGVVGEDGPLGIAVHDSPAGESFRAFQRYIKELSKRGVLLVAVSKNNPADAEEPFNVNEEMVLSLDDFAAFRAGWGAKSDSMRSIAEDLNLGLDSFVFFDDNPSERLEVRMNAPEVEVIEPGLDPAGYVGALEEGLFFETKSMTDEDRNRAQDYQARLKRASVEHSVGSTDEYLEGLTMTAELRPIDDQNMSRVIQLIGKTNQFNTTTKRHSEADVREMLSNDAVGLTLRLRDRYGDYGLICVLLGTPIARDSNGASAPKTIEMDTFLLSCRAMSRTAEHFMFNEFIHIIRAKGYKQVLASYIPTAKNQPVAALFPSLGFSTMESTGEPCERYALDIAEYAPSDTRIAPIGTGR
jgi:FkbH-like protein